MQTFAKCNDSPCTADCDDFLFNVGFVKQLSFELQFWPSAADKTKIFQSETTINSDSSIFGVA